MKKNILIVAAHPDDEILGAGATVARLVKEGYSAYSLILGEGITARDRKRDVKKHAGQLKKLKECVRKANRIVGVQEVFCFDFPDNRFDSQPLLDIVKTVEGIKVKVRPTIIFTHSPFDLNIDHRIAYQAVITAARPTQGETVKEIYSFEVPSSTDWAYPLRFSPNAFFDVSRTVALKMEALRVYQSEMRPWPHPRSFPAVKKNAELWGARMGVEFAEAFETVRILR